MTTITMSATAPHRIALLSPQMGLNGNSLFLRDVAFTRHMAKTILASTVAVIDQSGGVAQAANVITYEAVAVGGAAVGNNLADVNTTQSAFGTVLNATVELFAKANAALTKLNLPTVVYSGGGVGPTGTIAAVTQTVNGNSVGCPVATYNATVVAIDNAHYNIAIMIDQIAVATGTALLSGVMGIRAPWAGTPVSTVTAISTIQGTAASPAVLLTEANATLAQCANNIATFAATLNTAMIGYTVVPVVIVAN